MIGLIQRVSEARVVVGGDIVGEIGAGLLLFLGVEKGDNEERSDKLLKRILSYRIFPDADDKMNLSVSDVNGGLLIVSQFTLAADTQKGTRPSFSTAAPPALASNLYERFVSEAKRQIDNVETGIFAADMKVHLINDGPVTFTLKT